MSTAAAGIINPEALVYATGRPVITSCSGLVEHVEYCGEGGQGDLLLIAPCTANTIGKIAAGIDDTVVTTFATTAIGRGMPVVIAPAMHESMYRHPAVNENIKKLESWGITIIPPRLEEQRAKIAGIEEIVNYTMRGAGEGTLRGKCVLVTSGACREPVDDVRVLTTRATGAMGRAVALEAFRLGADVTVVHRDEFPSPRCRRGPALLERGECRVRVRHAHAPVTVPERHDVRPRREELGEPRASAMVVDLDVEHGGAHAEGDVHAETPVSTTSPADVDATPSRRRPADWKSASNSSRVRSRPPVTTSMFKSDNAARGSAGTVPTRRSTTRTRASATIARRHAARMRTAFSSSQSWRTYFST